ncbi:MAG: hypothetical protein ACYTFG_04245 [Planctomycetota bacterium]
MKSRVHLVWLMIFTVLWVSSPAMAVKGEWFTDVTKALTTAKKAGRPVLAVAMDHG